MIEMSITLLFGAVIVASVLAMMDCWLRGRFVFESLREERALLDAGFVPMKDAAQMRLRQPVRFDALATPSHVPAHRSIRRCARPTLPRPSQRSQRPERDAA